MELNSLETACQENDIKKFRELVRKQDIKDSLNKGYNTILTVAAKEGSHDIFKTVLEISTTNSLPIHEAAASKIDALVKVKTILQRNPKNGGCIKEYDGTTPIYSALYAGNIDVVEFLWEKGARISNENEILMECV